MVKNRGALALALDDKEQFCPLCMEELDLTDRSFHPCRCGYQVCLWCFHNIRDKLNGLCPACRTPYDNNSLDKLDPNLLAAAEADRKRKKEQQRVEKATARAAAAAAAADHKEVRPDRAVLQNVRVMQRNLVYITGLSPSIAKEETLRRKEHFGRFGRIVKVAVNKKTSTTTYSAYVTFRRNADASDCISHINSLVQEGKTTTRATFGTTKYCSFFLRHIQCNNPGCLYLHELANESECFTKEDLQHDFQMDEFDMDYHGSQHVHSAEPAAAAPSAADSQPKIDNSPAYRSTTPQPLISPIPGDSPARSVSAHEFTKPPAPSRSAAASETLPSGASQARISSTAKTPKRAARAVNAAAACGIDATKPGVAPSNVTAPAANGLSMAHEPRLRMPRPLSQSRRSFAIKDDDDSNAEVLLPGISALGLGKADSGPFGWDLQRHSEIRGSQKSTISPPDSPRTQHRVEQQKMFRSLLPNVDVSFVPHQNPRSADFHLFSPTLSSSRQEYQHFISQPPLVIEKTPPEAVIAPPHISDPQKQPLWTQSLPPTPSYPSHFDGFPRDRAPRAPPPGLPANGNHPAMSLPPRFGHHSPPPGMAPHYDPLAPGMMPPRFAHRPQSPAGGFMNPGSASEDYRISSQRCPPNVSGTAPGLIQRPSVEPVLHINGAWFGM